MGSRMLSGSGSPGRRRLPMRVSPQAAVDIIATMHDEDLVRALPILHHSVADTQVRNPSNPETRSACISTAEATYAVQRPRPTSPPPSPRPSSVTHPYITSYPSTTGSLRQLHGLYPFSTPYRPTSTSSHRLPLAEQAYLQGISLYSAILPVDIWVWR